VKAKKKAAPAKTKAPARKASARPKKYVYFFGGGKADGNRTMKDLLGGKGANLAEMTNAGLPVPPGFTISTEACNLYYDAGRKLPRPSSDEMGTFAGSRRSGAEFGSTTNPLLVSVRSGAKFSMPGMMDTILNLGLNDAAVEGLKAKHRQRALRLRQLPPLHPDVRQRRARDRQGQVRARVRRSQEGARRQGRHRPDEEALREVVERYKGS
jgi:hypothetical protein